MRRCLCCYQPLNEGEKDYHARCAKRFFGKSEAPSLPYTRKDVNRLAQVVVESRTTVTGVQAKLSMDLEHDAQGKTRQICAYPNLRPSFHSHRNARRYRRIGATVEWLPKETYGNGFFAGYGSDRTQPADGKAHHQSIHSAERQVVRLHRWLLHFRATEGSI